MGPETLVYALEGTDAQYFNIDSVTTRLRLRWAATSRTLRTSEPGTDPELDYDDPMKKQRFSVTVKVEVMDGDASQKDRSRREHHGHRRRRAPP